MTIDGLLDAIEDSAAMYFDQPLIGHWIAFRAANRRAIEQFRVEQSETPENHSPTHPCLECGKDITGGRLCGRCFVKVKT